CMLLLLLFFVFFFSSRRRHTRSKRDWSSDVCSSDLPKCSYSRCIPCRVYAKRMFRRLFRNEHFRFTVFWIVIAVRQCLQFNQAAPRCPEIDGAIAFCVLISCVLMYFRQGHSACGFHFFISFVYVIRIEREVVVTVVPKARRPVGGCIFKLEHFYVRSVADDNHPLPCYFGAFRYSEESFDFTPSSRRIFRRLAVIRHFRIQSPFEEFCCLVYIRDSQSDVVHASYYAQ